MSVNLFREILPEIANKEQISFEVMGEEELIPNGLYICSEAYCTQPNCNCKVAFLGVFWNANPKEDYVMLADIKYGFADKEYYIKRDEVENHGVKLNYHAEQSEHAERILEIFKTNILKNKEFTKMIRNHYRLVRELIDGPTLEGNKERTIGRNEKCNCGSGKKYKNCCGKK